LSYDKSDLIKSYLLQGTPGIDPKVKLFEMDYIGRETAETVQPLCNANIKFFRRVHLQQASFQFGVLGKQPNGSILDIAGSELTGKTELLMDAAVNCILPQEWCGISFNGCNTSVILLDLDCRFSFLRFVGILETRIRSIIAERGEASTDSRKTDYSRLLEECLSRFYFSKCNSSSQLYASLLSLEESLKPSPFSSPCTPESVQVRVLLIDGLSSFSDKIFGDVGAQYNKIFHQLKLLISSFSLYIVVSRLPVRFDSLSNWLQMVTIRFTTASIGCSFQVQSKDCLTPFFVGDSGANICRPAS
jgi:hypothetical protein